MSRCDVKERLADLQRLRAQANDHAVDTVQTNPNHTPRLVSSGGDIGSILDRVAANAKLQPTYRKAPALPAGIHIKDVSNEKQEEEGALYSCRAAAKMNAHVLSSGTNISGASNGRGAQHRADISGASNGRGAQHRADHCTLLCQRVLHTRACGADVCVHNRMHPGE